MSLALSVVALGAGIFVSWRSVIFPNYSMIGRIIITCRELHGYIAAYGTSAFLITLGASHLGSLDSLITIKIHPTINTISLDWVCALAVGLNTRKALQRFVQ